MIKLDGESLKDVFADVAAYEVLKEKGYSVTRELS